MNREKLVIEFIEYVRLLELKRLRNPMRVYAFGNCGNLHIFLKSAFPGAFPYMMRTDKYGKHVITAIDGNFFDIRGKLSLTEAQIDNTREISDEEVLKYINNYNQQQEKEEMRMRENAVKLREFADGKRKMAAAERFIAGDKLARIFTPEL